MYQHAMNNNWQKKRQIVTRKLHTIPHHDKSELKLNFNPSFESKREVIYSQTDFVCEFVFHNI